MKKVHNENKTSSHCEMQNVLAYENFSRVCVQAVYANLMALLSEYSESNSFTKAPDGSDPIVYFRTRIDKIEAMARQIYGNPELVSKITSVTNAIRKIICTHKFPGVPKEWYEINPNLGFYSMSFEFMIKDPKLYEKIKNGSIPYSLDFYPEESDIDSYHKYFAEMKRINEKENYHYSERDFFQKELVETVKIIFEELSIENN